MARRPIRAASPSSFRPRRSNRTSAERPASAVEGLGTKTFRLMRSTERDLSIARTRVGEILGAGHELVAHHMADCAEGSSLHYLEPILRV